MTDARVAIVLYVVAYATGIGSFCIMARRRGLATDGIAILAATALAGGALAAQLTQVLVAGEPGKTLLGAIAGGYLAVVVAKRALGICRPTGDLFAVALSAGEAIGRIGCFFAGCCYGKVTDVAWAVEQHGALRHPTQLYSAAAAAVTLTVLVAFEWRGTLPENVLFFVQGALLCASRFVIEAYRESSSVGFGLTIAQFVCLGGVLYCGLRLWRTFARSQTIGIRSVGAPV